ncbi:MAG: hypothetical protein ACKV2T_11475 [Kofleriaceae bacterium]
MSEPTTTTAPNPPTTQPEHDGGASDVIDFMTSSPLCIAGECLPSPVDLALAGIDLACTLFDGDDQSKGKHTYASLMADLAKYTEGIETPDGQPMGPLDVTQGFINEDPSVPEYVKFGADSPMTQQLMVDSGVVGAREAYYLEGFDKTASKFRLDDFVRETLELESPVQFGQTDEGQTSINIDTSDAQLTEHQVGSYTVKIAETPDGQLLFVVFNSTGRASGSRNPFTQESLFEDRARSEPGGFGTVFQAYYWTEPLRQ